MQSETRIKYDETGCVKAGGMGRDTKISCALYQTIEDGHAGSGYAGKQVAQIRCCRAVDDVRVRRPWVGARFVLDQMMPITSIVMDVAALEELKATCFLKSQFVNFTTNLTIRGFK